MRLPHKASCGDAGAHLGQTMQRPEERQLLAGELRQLLTGTIACLLRRGAAK